MNKNAEERVQRLFAGMKSSLNGTDPEFVEILSNFSQDETVSVSRLTEKEQMLCILSALLGCQGIGEFQNMLHAALNMEIDHIAIKEVIYQAAAYLGIFISSAARFWKKTKKHPELIAIVMAILCYMGHNFFCYQQIVCTPTIFILIGVGESIIRHE